MEHFPVTGVDSATDKTLKLYLFFYFLHERDNWKRHYGTEGITKDITDVVFYLKRLHLEVKSSVNSA